MLLPLFGLGLEVLTAKDGGNAENAGRSFRP